MTYDYITYIRSFCLLLNLSVVVFSDKFIPPVKPIRPWPPTRPPTRRPPRPGKGPLLAIHSSFVDHQYGLLTKCEVKVAGYGLLILAKKKNWRPIFSCVVDLSYCHRCCFHFFVFFFSCCHSSHVEERSQPTALYYNKACKRDIQPSTLFHKPFSVFFFHFIPQVRPVPWLFTLFNLAPEAKTLVSMATHQVS